MTDRTFKFQNLKTLTSVAAKSIIIERMAMTCDDVQLHENDQCLVVSAGRVVVWDHTLQSTGGTTNSTQSRMKILIETDMECHLDDIRV